MLLEADFQSEYHLNLLAHARETTGRRIRALIIGLLTANTRTRRALVPDNTPEPGVTDDG